MARKKGSPNKSQAVRDYLHANPDAKAREVVEALAQKGMKVAANLVYFLKGKSAAKKQRKARVVNAAKTATSGGVTSDPLTLIREVKTLAAKHGGMARLKELVDALAD